MSAGDDAVGDMIAEAMDRVGSTVVITIEDGRNMKDTLEVVEGLRIDRGYLSPYFVTIPRTWNGAENRWLLLTDRASSRRRKCSACSRHAAQAASRC